MNDAATPPPGATSVRPGPAEDHAGHDDGHQAPRAGIDTDHLRDYRALRRDTHDRKIAGVCGGLARHLDIDPTLVRVVLVVLTLFGGAGLLLYAALWVFVPETGSERALIDVGESARNVIVVVALAVALLLVLPSGFDGDAGAFIGLLLLGGVVAAVLLSRDSARRRQPGPAHDVGATSETWAGHAAPPAAPSAPSPYEHRPSPRRRGPLLFGITIASVVLALGVLGLVETAGTTLPDAAYPALALAVIGAWLVVGSVVGRPGGLVLLGIVSLAALGIAQIAEPTYDGDRELVERPLRASQLAPSYDLPAGRAEIDLTGIRDVEALDGRTLDVDVNAGEIVLVVPDDVTVELDAQVAAGGEISALNSNRGGWDVEVQQVLPADDPRATMHVNLDVGFGHIDVRSE